MLDVRLEHQTVKKAIIKSQHCQRNWDLEKTIPEDDLELILFSVTNCPSKQNHAFYKVHAITDRDKIETIHSETEGFLLPNGEWATNSQTLANLLLVFEEIDPSEKYKEKNSKYEEGNNLTRSRDVHMAVGIAAGYANLTSSILGYRTGCCACFNEKTIMETLGLKKSLILLMGIGFPDSERARRLHHSTNQLFPTKPKETIEVQKHK